MKKCNVCIIFNKEKNKILMCKREKEPFKNKFNFVGGKLLEHENLFNGAYRELEEESGITKNDVKLNHLMDFNYIYEGFILQVFVGILNKEKELVKEVNELYWMNINENFFDYNKFAGNGNIGHILIEAKINYLDRN